MQYIIAYNRCNINTLSLFIQQNVINVVILAGTLPDITYVSYISAGFIK